MGRHLMGRLRDWPARFPIVGDVRGLGLMVGIEFVRGAKEPAPDLRDRFEQLAFDRRLLLLGAGRSAIRLCPPLVVSRAEVDQAVDVMEECLRALD
jgi:4-aminobutyrate aminotransferase